MTNAERISAHNAKLQECLTIAEGLPDAGGGTCDKPHVIEVEVLPTENIDENAVYLCGGRYYKYVAGGGTYKFNDVIVETGAYVVENPDDTTIPDGIFMEAILDGNTKYIVAIYSPQDDFYVVGAYDSTENPESQEVEYLYQYASGFTVLNELSGKTIEVVNVGIYEEWLNANATLISGGGGWKEWIPKEECGGGAELNIAYGDTPPEDTTKLWCKCDEPSGVIVSKDIEMIQGSGGVSTISLDYENLRGAGYGVFEDNIYLICGQRYPSIISIFDTKTETYTTTNHTLQGDVNQSFLYGTVGNKVYIFGGSNGGSKKKVIQYFDMESQVVTTLSQTLPNFNFESGNAHTDGTLIYLLGGNGTNGIYCFDTEKTEGEALETLATVLPMGISHSAYASVGKKVYIFGGRSKGAIVDTIMCFDSEKLSATTISETLPIPMALMSAAALGTNIYIFGGSQDVGSVVENAYNTILRFDTKTETLEVLPIVLPHNARTHISAVVNNKVYIFGSRYENQYTRYPIYRFAEETPSLPSGKIHIVPTLTNNIFPIVNTDNIEIEIGVGQVYKGNENNEAKIVESALYKDGTWTTI